jgi:hypothetical protein
MNFFYYYFCSEKKVICLNWLFPWTAHTPRVSDCNYRKRRKEKW